MVKLIQLNVGKRVAATNEIRVRQAKGEIDVLLMQEPWVDKFTIKNKHKGTTYCYSGTLSSNLNVRAAIWVKKNLNKACLGEMLGDFTSRDTVTLKLNIKHKKGHNIKLIICSNYMPCELTDPNQLKNLINYCKNNKDELIIGGDLMDTTKYGEAKIVIQEETKY